MFDPITLALISSAIGGLTNKKNPLKGALLGGGLGYGGGLLAAPGAAIGTSLPAGGMTATGATPLADAGLMGVGGLSALPAGGMTATGGLGIGEAALMGAHGGMDSAIANPTAFQSFMGYAKPVGEAAIAANAAKGLFSSPPPLPPSPITPAQPNGNLNQIVAGNNQQSQLFNQLSEQERARRMALLANIGGYRGTTR